MSFNRKIYMQEYWQKNKTKLQKYSNNWHKNHPNYHQQMYIKNKEHELKIIKNWRKNNPDKVKKYDKKYRNSEKGKLLQRRRCKKYYINHKQFCIECSNEYRKTINGKKTKAKSTAKRKNLGFNPINNWFKGCEGHHLNKIDVIYIPKDLHRSIYHNVFTGKNMISINNLAFSWLNYTETNKNF